MFVRYLSAIGLLLALAIGPFGAGCAKPDECRERCASVADQAQRKAGDDSAKRQLVTDFQKRCEEACAKAAAEGREPSRPTLR